MPQSRMSTGPSRKEQRRQAALREMERRSVEAEATARAGTSDLDWGTASQFSSALRVELLRIGARPDNPTAATAIEVLSQQIKWPQSLYRSSVRRYRETHPNTDGMSDLAIEDATACWCRDFRFSVSGSFYSDWQHDFTGTDPDQFTPLGADSHYFYFLGSNSSDVTDPLVYNVDHETVNETPCNRRITLTEFLSLLAAA